jgi:hypothetical protein
LWQIPPAIDQSERKPLKVAISKRLDRRTQLQNYQSRCASSASRWDLAAASPTPAETPDEIHVINAWHPVISKQAAHPFSYHPCVRSRLFGYRGIRFIRTARFADHGGGDQAGIRQKDFEPGILAACFHSEFIVTSS